MSNTSQPLPKDHPHPLASNPTHDQPQTPIQTQDQSQNQGSESKSAGKEDFEFIEAVVEDEDEYQDDELEEGEMIEKEDAEKK